MVSSCTAAGIGFVEVSSVAVYGVNHVAFAVCDDGQILGSNVVQELFQLCHCVCPGLCLLQCKCAEGAGWSCRRRIHTRVVCQGLVGGVSVVPCQLVGMRQCVSFVHGRRSLEAYVDVGCLAIQMGWNFQNV